MKTMLSIVVLSVAVIADATDFESENFRLDLTCGRRHVEESEEIFYSSEWVEGSSSDREVVLCVNDAEISRLKGTGSFEWWRPSHAGVYTLTHRVMEGEDLIGDVLTATFVVDGPAAPEFMTPSGTVFDVSMSVNISCTTEGATIHYTVDGSEPTELSPEYKRFRVYDRTLVRAVAVKDGMAMSQVVSAEYALGQCGNPIITPCDGTHYEHSNQEVVIDWSGIGGTLFYTVDGSEPTESSLEYKGAFTISETTVVKAKVIGNSFFDSGTVTAVLTREKYKVQKPLIDAAESFQGSKTSVAIGCQTPGAIIRYTIDGSDPMVNGMVYAGPFDVTSTAIVKAIALLTDWEESEVASCKITKVWRIGDAMNDPDRTFTTDAVVGWKRDQTISNDGVECMRSGPIEDSENSGGYAETLLTTTVNGKGTVRFWWKASCEEDPLHEWDHGEFRFDGEAKYIDGITDWQEVVVDFLENGLHTLSWVYLKDEFGMDGDDCVWVDRFSWTPETASEPIPDLGDNPTMEEIANVFSDGKAEDRLLAQRITNKSDYVAFRAWSENVKLHSGSEVLAGQAEVLAAPNAWLSFALGSETLIETAPTDGDLKVDNFEPATESGKFDFTVSVTDIEVGADATADNLKKVFGLEGGTTLEPGCLSSDNVNITFGTPENGKVKFTAGPKNTSEGTFFMKVKMTP